MSETALVIGGTGPTGPFIVHGLTARGYDVTVMHTGAHEIDAVASIPHIHTDVRSEDAMRTALEGLTFDVVIATYGRLRAIAEVVAGRCGRFICVGGVPALRGYFDADRHDPPGLPVPVDEMAPTATEDDDGKSYRIARTEAVVFSTHPEATILRYPFLYGPHQLVPREWLFVRRILDGRNRIILPDGGMTLITHAYTENAAHAVLLAVDHATKASGEVFHVGDDECLTVAQVGRLVAEALDTPIDFVSMPFELAAPTRPMVAQHRNTHRVLDTAKIRQRLGYRDVVDARSAVAATARWLADNRPELGGVEERVLEDPFDYAAEDRLLAWWDEVVAAAPDPQFVSPPGFGLAYGGPGTTYERPTDRI